MTSVFPDTIEPGRFTTGDVVGPPELVAVLTTEGDAISGGTSVSFLGAATLAR